jgi:hypothetical protein
MTMDNVQKHNICSNDKDLIYETVDLKSEFGITI